MADKGPSVPTPKATRAKITNQTKTKKPFQKNSPKQKSLKKCPSIGTKSSSGTCCTCRSIRRSSPLYPPNHPNQLPDTPPYQSDQPPNNPPNQPNPPPNQQPNPPPQAPMQPHNPQGNPPNPMQPQVPPVQVPQLCWSYFKPVFSGKPDEDTIAHLLRTNDWVETHNFPDEIKVQRFCLTLTGEARLWYETLRPIEVDWTGLQECFRQQYSKFGNTKKQYFYVWRSFHYDESTNTIDSYISKIKHVAVLLNYGEPQISELFKHTLLSKLYWILFPINNWRDAVDATKRVLTKEKLDKQLSAQATTSTPFMKVGDASYGKKVSFNLQDSIREQLENLTSMVYNMSMQKEEGKTPFKPQVYPKRARGQRRQNFDGRNRSFQDSRQRQIFRQSQNR